jgi:NitT/TauT family transport system substrate-binding protein
MRRSRALSLLAAAPAVGAPQIVRAQARPLRLGAAINDSYAESYFGNDAGIFARNGLDVEVSAFPNAQAIIQAVSGGAIDLGMADMIQIANASAHGLDYAFFAGGSLYRTEAPSTLFCVSRNSPIRTAKDLEGQTVAVTALASISSICVTEWLRRNGADITKVKLFEMPFSPMAPALARGTVAAAFIAEPFYHNAKDDLRVLASTYDTIAKQFYIGAWFAPREWLTKNAATAKRLTTAIYQTAAWANTHRDETAVTLNKVSKIDLETIKGMTRSSWGTSLDLALMQPILDIAARYNAIEKPTAAAQLVVRV